MHGNAHCTSLGSWTAIGTGLTVCGLGLLRLLLQGVMVVVQLGTLWAFPSPQSGLAPAVLGQLSPLMLSFNLSAAGLLLAFYGLQRLPLGSSGVNLPARRKLS